MVLRDNSSLDAQKLNQIEPMKSDQFSLRKDWANNKQSE